MEKHAITETEINAFIAHYEMKPLGGDRFEDAGGHVWHEANIIEWLELPTHSKKK